MVDKKKEPRTDAQQKTDTALQKADFERQEKEWALAPYTANLGNYDRGIRVQQMQWLLQQDVMSHFAKGCILMEIKEREDAKTFSQILSEEFGGMSLRSAQHYMLYAKKCVDLKKIKEFGVKNWSKMITLMHSTTDEQLKEIEDKGINGKVLDEFDGLSVRDFKKLLKKYKTDTEKVVKAETHDLKVERDSLVKELDRLKAFDPENNDVAWSVPKMEAISKLHDELDTALRLFAFDKRILAHPELQAKVEGIQREIEARFKLFTDNWDAQVDEEQD